MFIQQPLCQNKHSSGKQPSLSIEVKEEQSIWVAENVLIHQPGGEERPGGEVSVEELTTQTPENTSVLVNIWALTHKIQQQLHIQILKKKKTSPFNEEL